MRRAPLVSLVAAAALTVAGLVPAASAQPDGQPGGQPGGRPGAGTPADKPTDKPTVPPAGAAAAERTLQSVESALAGPAPQHPAQRDNGRDLTLLLRDLRAQLPALRGADRRQAQAFLARPTDGDSDPFGDGYEADAENDCGAGERGAQSTFCVFWVKNDPRGDAPPPADVAPRNGVPDQVDRTRDTIQLVWDREVGDAGYKRPLRDAGSPHAGPNRKLDIYLADIGRRGYFGYCVSEPAPGRGNDEAAYCVLDDDFSKVQFDGDPLENLQVTAAHEFFHAVQFAYDAFEDTWLLEGTATWIEDQVFDDNDGNRYYLGWSALSNPAWPLDRSWDYYVYGSWLWWRFLTERYPASAGSGIPTLVRKVWEAADDSDADNPGTYALAALRKVLARRNTDLTTQFARFGVANRQPAASYEEGAAYPTAPLAGSTRMTQARPTRPTRAARLDHLTTRTLGYLPGHDLAQPGWRLRLRVDAPAARHSPAVSVTTFLTGGRAVTKRIRLDRDGAGARSVPFTSGTGRRVELTLSNAGHRFVCDRQTFLSCQGRSRSDDLPFRYAVRLTR